MKWQPISNPNCYPLPSLPSTIVTLYHRYPLPLLPSTIVTLYHRYPLPLLPSTIVTLYHRYPLPLLPSTIVTLYHCYPLPLLPSTIVVLYYRYPLPSLPSTIATSWIPKKHLSEVNGMKRGIFTNISRYDTNKRLFKRLVPQSICQWHLKLQKYPYLQD